MNIIQHFFSQITCLIVVMLLLLFSCSTNEAPQTENKEIDNTIYVVETIDRGQTPGRSRYDITYVVLRNQSDSSITVFEAIHEEFLRWDANNNLKVKDSVHVTWNKPSDSMIGKALSNTGIKSLKKL